jgi:amino acid transporter
VRARRLKLLDIVLLNVVAVTSLRWLASAGAAGPSSLSLWVLAALFFFLPQGLAVAALSVRSPGEGGLYRWTKEALGERHGFLCGWCYWVNNLLYFPSLLIYVSGNVALAIQALRPEWALEKNGDFVLACTLVCLWLVAGLSLLGLSWGRRLQNFGAVANWVPAAIIVGLGAAAYATWGSANAIRWETVVPKLSSFGDWSYFAQICFALAGLELVSFFEGDAEKPSRTVPLALGIASVLILAVYVLGTLGILVSVPQSELTLVNGVLLPIQQVSAKFGIGWLGTVAAFLIVGAGLGAVFAWFNGSARVPYLVGVDRYLPASFGKLHPTLGTPVNAILLQTAVATLLTLFATAGSTRFEATYKILVDMCLILYFIPYAYLFLAVPKLLPDAARPLRWASYVGLAVTTVAIVTTAFPTGAEIDGVALAKTLGGTAIMLAFGLGSYAWAHRRAVAPNP